MKTPPLSFSILIAISQFHILEQGQHPPIRFHFFLLPQTLFDAIFVGATTEEPSVQLPQLAVVPLDANLAIRLTHFCADDSDAIVLTEQMEGAVGFYLTRAYAPTPVFRSPETYHAQHAYEEPKRREPVRAHPLP